MTEIIKDELAQSAVNILESCAIEIERLFEELDDEYRQEYYKQAEEAINAWYRSYSQRRYSPKGDLYNIYRLEPIEYGTIFRIGPEFMQYQHNQSNEYIYQNSVIEGYHGGSIGIDKNDEMTLVPRYRTPYNKWYKWGRYAPKTDIDLEQYLYDLDDVVFNETKNKFQSKFDDVIKRWNTAWDYLYR